MDFAGFSNKDIFVFLDKALENDPKCVDALLNKGFVLDRTGLYKKAIECFDKILEIDPKNVRATYSKGVSLFSLKKYAEARFYCQRALDLEPTNVKALCSMVWLLAHHEKI